MSHILLVEDAPAIATSLNITCKREGWQMTWLDSASTVLDFLRTDTAASSSAQIKDSHHASIKAYKASAVGAPFL